MKNQITQHKAKHECFILPPNLLCIVYVLYLFNMFNFVLLYSQQSDIYFSLCVFTPYASWIFLNDLFIFFLIDGFDTRLNSATTFICSQQHKQTLLITVVLCTCFISLQQHHHWFLHLLHWNRNCFLEICRDIFGC